MRDTKVAALIREICAGARAGSRKVSLRASDDDVDVSAIARAFGGGGHRRAAGFTSELPAGELIDAIRAWFERTRARRAVLLADKPVGLSSHDIVARARRALGRGASGTPARSTRSPAAC